MILFLAVGAVLVGTAAILRDLRQIVKKLDILIGDQDRHPAEKEEFTRKGDI